MCIKQTQATSFNTLGKQEKQLTCFYKYIKTTTSGKVYKLRLSKIVWFDSVKRKRVNFSY